MSPPKQKSAGWRIFYTQMLYFFLPVLIFVLLLSVDLLFEFTFVLLLEFTFVLLFELILVVFFVPLPIP